MSPRKLPAGYTLVRPGVGGEDLIVEPGIGALLPTDKYPQNKKCPKLFEPLAIRSVTYKNRIWFSPTTQYSAIDGKVTDWHLVHLGALAARGMGSIMIESTAVTAQGRISPWDIGIWSDDHIEPLSRIVKFVHAHGAKIGLQLGHAGRKASIHALWTIDATSKILVEKEDGGWPDNVIGPSDLAYDEVHAQPKAMTLDQIQEVEEAYAAATRRCKIIGLDHLEIHMAHGFLLHSFYSPLSNKRTDQYGGSFENRTRLPLQITARVRKEWGEEKPLFVRLSATDWAQFPEKNEKGEWAAWGLEQTVLLSGELQKVGADLIDLSSAGNWPGQKIEVGPGYQVPFAAAVKAAHPSLLVNAVGMITEPEQAERYLQEGKCDTISVSRVMNRHADWVYHAAQTLGVVVKPATQYGRSYVKMLKPSTRL